MRNVGGVETDGLFVLVSLFSNRISIGSFFNDGEGLANLSELRVKVDSLGNQELDEEILSNFLFFELLLGNEVLEESEVVSQNQIVSFVLMSGILF